MAPAGPRARWTRSSYLRAQPDARVLHRGHPGGRQGVLREARARLEGPVTAGRAPASSRCCAARPSASADGRRRGAGARRGASPAHAGVHARMVGTPGRAARAARYDEDLRDARGCLLEAGGQLSRTRFHDGDFPVLCAGDCSICVTTLPVLARDRPDAFVLWLDAHGDFNSPATSPSGFLGGMGLAGACGVWETGFDGAVARPRRASSCAACATSTPASRCCSRPHGVSRIERPSRLADALAGREVFIHLDLDVLDPSVVDGLRLPGPRRLQRRGAAPDPRRGRRGRDRRRHRDHRAARARRRRSWPPAASPPLVS